MLSTITDKLKKANGAVAGASSVAARGASFAINTIGSVGAMAGLPEAKVIASIVSPKLDAAADGMDEVKKSVKDDAEKDNKATKNITGKLTENNKKLTQVSAAVTDLSKTIKDGQKNAGNNVVPIRKNMPVIGELRKAANDERIEEQQEQKEKEKKNGSAFGRFAKGTGAAVSSTSKAAEATAVMAGLPEVAIAFGVVRDVIPSIGKTMKWMRGFMPQQKRMVEMTNKTGKLMSRASMGLMAGMAGIMAVMGPVLAVAGAGAVGVAIGGAISDEIDNVREKYFTDDRTLDETLSNMRYDKLEDSGDIVDKAFMGFGKDSVNIEKLNEYGSARNGGKNASLFDGNNRKIYADVLHHADLSDEDREAIMKYQAEAMKVDMAGYQATALTRIQSENVDGSLSNEEMKEMAYVDAVRMVSLAYGTTSVQAEATTAKVAATGSANVLPTPLSDQGTFSGDGIRVIDAALTEQKAAEARSASSEQNGGTSGNNIVAPVTNNNSNTTIVAPPTKKSAADQLL